MSRYSKGFTVVEIIFVVVILSLASVLFFVQKNNLEVTARDNQRKSSINAMFYSLEESFYKTNKFYPNTISESNLKTLDPEMLIDTKGFRVGEPESEYRYEPAGCKNEKCKSYTLRAALEAEEDFVKESRNN